MEWLEFDEDGIVRPVADEIRLVPELQVISTLVYNRGPKDSSGRKKYRLLNELKYLYLVYSPKSPYKDYSPTDRLQEAISDCNFTPDWKPSKELNALIARYNAATPNRIMRLLKTTEDFIDKFDKHLRNIDLDERNAAQGLVHKATDIMGTLERLPRLSETLFELEKQARVGVVTKVTSKGDHEVGLMALKKMNGRSKRNTGVGDSAATEEGDSKREF